MSIGRADSIWQGNASKASCIPSIRSLTAGSRLKYKCSLTVFDLLRLFGSTSAPASSAFEAARKHNSKKNRNAGSTAFMEVCMDHHRCSVNCIVPPHILVKLLESKDRKLREIALHTLLSSTQIRAKRDLLSCLP